MVFQRTLHVQLSLYDIRLNARRWNLVRSDIFIFQEHLLALSVPSGSLYPEKK
jgi:hypothetical protein